MRNPGRVIAVGLALAALGWGLDTQTHVETNLEKLVPQNLASLRNLDALERASGVGGEIDLMVSGANVATPAAIEWMSSYQSTVLRRFGYTSTRGCGRALAVPGLLAADAVRRGALDERRRHGFRTAVARAAAAKSAPCRWRRTAPPKLTPAEVNGLLRAIPPYFSQNAITANRRVATLAFGIRLMPLAATAARDRSDARRACTPRAGVSAQLVGLPVLAAQSGALVASPWRRVLTLLAGLAAAALVLLVGVPRRPPPGADAAACRWRSRRGGRRSWCSPSACR